MKGTQCHRGQTENHQWRVGPLSHRDGTGPSVAKGPIGHLSNPVATAHDRHQPSARMSTGCHDSQTHLRCASLLRMPTTRSSVLRRRALPSLLTGLLACAGSAATVDVTSAGTVVRSSTVAAGAAVPSAGCRLAAGPTVTNQQQT